MTLQAHFSLRRRNPDVLTCIANLSNDEVFTPPELANQMLDKLADAWAKDHNGADIWADPEVTFLDPCTKSGVFLREITARLTKGLVDVIPDLETRVDHILKHQVFGIAITKLTSMLARRSLYCSKHANGEHSIARCFDSDSGNVWFERTEHRWDAGICTFCGVSQSAYDRGDDMETHAYAFIHADNIRDRLGKIFGEQMQFDVIIGNPPYQLGADGGTRDKPIYQHFVEQAKKLEPRYLSMVIPSRWMAGGLGLTEFRRTMLSDRRIRSLVDYPNAAEVFPSVGINGGICYFLWDASHDDTCTVSTIRAGAESVSTDRALDEFDVMVRDDRALSILRKVLKRNEPSVNTILARDKEFGWTSNFDGFHSEERAGDIKIFYIRNMKRKHAFISRNDVTKSEHLIDTWKLLVPKVGSGRERERTGVDLVLGPSLLAPSPSVCTQSFLFFYVNSRAEAESVQSYYKTRFFRFLVSLRKITQDATHSTYLWVPIQTWDRLWTDDELFEKYKINSRERTFIESIIRPMTGNHD